MALKKPLPEQIAKLEKLNTTIIADTFDALGIHGVMSNMKPVISGKLLVGPAVTVKQRRLVPTPPSVRTPEAIESCDAGDVMVIDCGGDPYNGAWGGLLTLRAILYDVAGAVVGGAVRDTAEIREYRFPVWSEYVTPIGANKRFCTVSINDVVECAGATVCPGDIIIADDDGVCVIPFESLDEVIKKAEEVYESEQKVINELKSRKKQ